MKQMTKKELKEKVYNEFLFGSDYNDESKIRVIKIRCNCDDVSLEVANYSCFYMDINHNYEKYTLERKCNIVSLNVKEQLFIGANNIIRNKFGNLQILDKELNDKTNDYRRSNFVNLHFKVNDNVIGLSSKSTIKESNIISPLSSNASELDTVTNFEIPKFDSFNVIMYFVNSKSNPVIFVIDENDELDWYKLLEEKKYLYCSLDFKSFITTTTSNTNSVHMKIDDPLSISEKCYEASSIGREIVKYNKDGEVIFYENPVNMITMEKTIQDNFIEEKVFFRDILIVYNYCKRDKYVYEEINEWFGSVNSTKVVYDEENPNNYTSYTRIGTCEKVIEYVDNTEEKTTCNYSAYEPNYYSVYSDIPRPIIVNDPDGIHSNIKNDNGNLIGQMIGCTGFRDQTYGIKLYGWDEKEVILSLDKKYLSDGINLNSRFSNVLSKFRSSSGIVFDKVEILIPDDIIFIQKYKDNDLEVEFNKGDREIKSFKSLIYNKDNYYIRNEFGIPQYIYYRNLKTNAR